MIVSLFLYGRFGSVPLLVYQFSPPLVLLRDIHDGLLTKYDWKDSVTPPGQPGRGIVLDVIPKMVYLSRRLLRSSFCDSTDSMRLIYGERMIPTLSSCQTQHRVTQKIITRGQSFNFI
jgi:hypothetical protein